MNVQIRDGKHTMEVLDHTGHSTVTWDPENETSVADARAQFDRLRARGFSIFRMVPIGQTAVVEEPDLSTPVETFDPAAGRFASVRMDEFDPAAERATAIPQRVGG